MSFFRLLRITILLAILVIVAGGQWLTWARATDWEDPLWITVYPIVVDENPSTEFYVRQLDAEDFSEIGDFLERQGRRHGRELDDPLTVQVAPATHEAPPPTPMHGERLATAVWSLKMRWWAWRMQRSDKLPKADVQMFVLYRSGSATLGLDRSVGVRKGMYGIVNAYTGRLREPRNRLVLTHELLHVLGATDKYDLATGQPRAPQGLAEPGRSPLYPQERAEIMAGRIALSETRFEMPGSLTRCVIGPETAEEIGF